MPDLNTELAKLADLKSTAAAAGGDKKEADAEFKQQQSRCLDLMEAMRCKSWRDDDSGTLFTRVEDRVKGQVEDRRKYIRWCLEQDEAVQEFINAWRQPDAAGSFEEDFFDLLVNGLELVAVKEKQDKLNAQARTHIDDEQPLPPGATFRPDPYIQQRRS